MTSEIDTNIEPLPGYRLLERIGAGGYGEVWRAEAPGGLTKAIKFVFGKHNEKRATNELRALDHVRCVRHPFLLSLERAEVVDGRLLIVSELADGSVKDRFDACRREGLCGIPRNELLSYLRDAADALDYMSDSHTLQHLDIKPENLLLLSGRVKVADFGLVKDVRQSQASMVGGMTPLYSAPEVFRGTPSRHSDQYSLAIVYQEMLTGALPFAYGNAAELTLQHLNDEPDLSSLSAADRYVASRALSKDPEHRYVSCREFIDSLLKATDAGKSANAGGSDSNYAPEGGFTSGLTRATVPTDVFDECDTAYDTTPQLLVELPAANLPLVDLPPVDLTARETRPVPTLVLGIGGTAARVLSHLRALVHEQLCGQDLPTVQFLLVDTDSKGISEVTRGDGSGLKPEETLNLPLRRPQHYREHAQQLLGWLSRRWLYNIPRSLQTEGLRPLGRLALADHARQTVQRIRRTMAQALDAQAVTASNQALGTPVRSDALRVYVVASISGGTGGGMSLDMGYAVQAIVEKLGLTHAQVCGLMLHSTGGEPRYNELARVNALSWLTEFRHFCDPTNSYPGDASCGFPPHEAGILPFDYTYLVHLGENLNSTEFDQAAGTVAEFLRLNILTPAGVFFDSCRETEGGKILSTAAGQLRSFGLFRRSAAPAEFCDEFAAVVSEQVLTLWRRQPKLNQSEGAGPLAPGAEQLVKRLQLESNGIAANTRALLELQLGSDSATFLSTWFANQLSGDFSEQAQWKAVDRIFDDADSAGTEASRMLLLGLSATAYLEPFSEKLRTEIRRWLIVRLDDCQHRLNGARDCAAWLQSHCRSMESELRQARSVWAERILTLRREIDAEPAVKKSVATTSPTAAPRVLAYFRSRFNQLATLAAEHVVHLLLCDAKAIADEVTSLGREIDQIAAAQSRSAGPGTRNSAPATRSALANGLQEKLPTIAANVDRRLQAEYISQHGGLLNLVMRGGRPRAQLTARLHELARQAVQQAFAGVNVLEDALHAGGTNVAELRSDLSSATPSLLGFGGTRRVLAILPRDSAGNTDSAAIAAALGVPVTTVAGVDNGFMLCVEAGQLQVDRIGIELVQRRRDRVEFAARVHCRTDIDWSPLVETTSGIPAADWNIVGSAQPAQSRDAMCKTMVL